VTCARARALVAAGAGLWLTALAVRMGAATAVPAPRPTTEAAPVAATLPERLSETGLYSDTGALVVDSRNRPFAPQYPLWSDGADKRRWVRLPDGAVIDAREADAWDFPVGTRFWKEFVFAGVKVETRHLVKTAADRWVFASYMWDTDQRDARRVPAEGVPNVAEVAPGKRHGIPSEAECRACHDSGRTEVLGFNALQLSDDRDPLAPHAEPLAPGMVTLRTLVDEGRLRALDAALVHTPPRIVAADATERAVLGYLSTNCGSCHNRRSSIASLGLFLQYSLRSAAGGCAPDAVATTLGRSGHWVVPAAPEGASRLVFPGRGDLSAMLVRARSRRPSSQMPPIGTVVADKAALALVQQWIASLDAGRATCAAPATTF
jgi:hypothetical protein